MERNDYTRAEAMRDDWDSRVDASCRKDPKYRRIVDILEVIEDRQEPVWKRMTATLKQMRDEWQESKADNMMMEMDRIETENSDRYP